MLQPSKLRKLLYLHFTSLVIGSLVILGLYVHFIVLQIYMYNSKKRTTREISLNSSLEAIYVHHMHANTSYTIQMSAVTRKGEGVRSQTIVIGMWPH